MRRAAVVVSLAVAVALSLAAAPVAAGPQSSPRVVLGHTPLHKVPRKWTHRGACSSTPASSASMASACNEVRFALHLHPADRTEFDRRAAAIADPDSSTYGQHMTQDEIDALLRPADAHITAVHAWLAAHGVPAPHLRHNAMHVNVAHPVAEALLETRIHQFMHPHLGVPVVRQVGSFSQPRDVHAAVKLLSGLTEYVAPRRHARIAAVVPKPAQHQEHHTSAKEATLLENTASAAATAAAAAAASPSRRREVLADDLLHAAVTPAAIREYYHIPLNLINRQVSNKQAAVGFNDVFKGADLATFQKIMGLPNATVARTVRREASNTRNHDESDLDVEFLMGVGQGVETWFFEQNHDDWLLGFLSSVQDEKDPPHTFSISYGWAEADQCFNAEVGGKLEECSGWSYEPTKYVEHINDMFKQAGSRGITMVVSAGDDGAPGNAANCPLEPQDQSKCSQITIKKTSEDAAPIYCHFPLIDTEDCTEILSNAECKAAMGTFVSQNTDDPCKLNVTGVSAESNSADAMLRAGCACGDLKYTTKGRCEVGLYTYDIAKGAPFRPDFPASSPFVTSVGATTFARRPSPACRVPGVLCPRGEVSASSRYAGSSITTGGGFAVYSAMPEYQRDIVQYYLANAGKDLLPPATFFNKDNRAFPDVAAVGSSCMTVADGELTAMDGTSCAAPVFAGMISLLNGRMLDKGQRPLGFLNPMLYKMGKEHPEAFNDVSMGDSRCTGNPEVCCKHGWHAGPGWDPLTGLGSPHFAEMMRYVMAKGATGAVPSVATNPNQDNGHPKPSPNKTDSSASASPTVTPKTNTTAASAGRARNHNNNNHNNNNNNNNDGSGDVLVQVQAQAGADPDPYVTRGTVFVFGFVFFVILCIPAGVMILFWFRSKKPGGGKEMASKKKGKGKGKGKKKQIYMDDDDEPGE